MAHAFYLRGKRGTGYQRGPAPLAMPPAAGTASPLPLFAASPNDIPEGGTGELLVATATGHQGASEACSREGCRFPPLLREGGLRRQRGRGPAAAGRSEERGCCDARAVVPFLWVTAKPICLGDGEGGREGILSAAAAAVPTSSAQRPAPCRASARGEPEMPTSLPGHVAGHGRGLCRGA